MHSSHKDEDLRKDPGSTSGTSAVAGSDNDPQSANAPGARANALVHALCGLFVQQVQQALKLELDYTPLTLAYVDHYLSKARDEQRSEILSLLSAQAGAYFGEIIRREIGGFWIGDEHDPRNLRLLLEPQLIHFSPIDMAYEAIITDSPSDDDPRHPPGRSLDASFHLDKSSPESKVTSPSQAKRGEGGEATDRPLSDAEWLADRLAQTNPVPVDEYYSLTGRFETLQLILELLAAKHIAEGKGPRVLSFPDYVTALAT